MSNPLAIKYRRLGRAGQRQSSPASINRGRGRSRRTIYSRSDFDAANQTDRCQVVNGRTRHRFMAAHPGLIAPALAISITKVPSGVRWTHDIKFDGYRVQVHIRERRSPPILGRHGLARWQGVRRDRP
jgi:ATP-dependent DNA ligase